MDWLKKMIKENIEIILAVVIGISLVTVYQLFFAENGLFVDFTKEVIDFGMQRIRTEFGMPMPE